MANHFAACFLMPGDSLIESYHGYIGRGYSVTGTDVAMLSRNFGVSYSAMLVRLKDIRLIADNEYEQLEKVQPEKMAEEIGLPPVELNLSPLPGRYICMATKLYLQEEISIGKLAEYLKRNIAEIQQFVMDLRNMLVVEEVFDIA